jgi:uncharacterized protein
MGASVKSVTFLPFTANIVGRVLSLDWKRIAGDLHSRGSALLERILSPVECRSLARLYSDEGLFRSS